MEACAIRETLEETGLRITSPQFLAVTNDVFAAEGKHYITVWTRSESVEGEPAVQDTAEVAELGWFQPDELPSPLFLSLANLAGGRALPAGLDALSPLGRPTVQGGRHGMNGPSTQHGATGVSASALLAIVGGRRGHFRLESGYHGALWLDLDALFADSAVTDPFVSRLVASVRAHRPDIICGPLLGGAFLAQLVARALGVEFSFAEREAPPAGDGLFRARYRLPPAYGARVRGKRVAIVDDVMSAGSSLRATHADLESHGARVVAAGALLVLGRTGADWFTSRNIPVEAAARDDYESWAPDACPLCREGIPLEDATRPEIPVTPEHEDRS